MGEMSRRCEKGDVDGLKSSGLVESKVWMFYADRHELPEEVEC